MSFQLVEVTEKPSVSRVYENYIIYNTCSSSYILIPLPPTSSFLFLPPHFSSFLLLPLPSSSYFLIPPYFSSFCFLLPRLFIPLPTSFCLLLSHFTCFCLNLLLALHTSSFLAHGSSEGTCVSHCYQTDGCCGEPNMHCPPHAVQGAIATQPRLHHIQHLNEATWFSGPSVFLLEMNRITQNSSGERQCSVASDCSALPRLDNGLSTARKWREVFPKECKRYSNVELHDANVAATPTQNQK